MWSMLLAPLMLQPVTAPKAPALRPTMRGGVGMLHTPMAMTGRPASLRVALQSDFFRKRSFFCCTGVSSADDAHQRYRSVFVLGWTPLSWLELHAGLEHAVNRNDRLQATREDPTQIYAMGDSWLGMKLVAPWWQRVVRVGLAQRLQLLSRGSSRDKGRVRYAADLVVTGDFLAHTQPIPLRLSASVGAMLDPSYRMYDWSSFQDPVSREVFRFGVDTHQHRLRSRVGIDAPLVLGQSYRVGLTPMLELQWDRSFQAQDAFEMPPTPQQSASVQRSGVQMSAAVAVYPVPALHVDLGYQITLLQPDFAFGPKLAPWTLALALGGSFDLGRK